MSDKDACKFRVWDETTHKYNTNVYITYVLTEDGSLLVADNTFYEHGVNFRCPRHPCKVERCTGLKDCAGKLIYHNDKVLVSFTQWAMCTEKTPDEEFVVGWRCGVWELRNDRTVLDIDSMDIESIKVLGTIHD